jgi:hypothetical protein
MKPNLKLKIDIKQDVANAQDRFWHSARYNSPFNWFFPKNFRYILSDNFSNKERDKIISEYSKNFYQVNKDEVTAGFAQVKKQWQKEESRFYKIVGKLFKGHSWPKVKYTGYVSIFNMFPRNSKEKYFYFPYDGKKLLPTKTIAHEMLHFIFFDFIGRKYGADQNTEFAGKNPRYVWRVSETFNNIIENWRPYKKIFGLEKESKPYPGCEKMFQAMKKQWAKSQDIDKFLDKWLLVKNKTT